MEQLKLPGLKPLEFFTPEEKKPQHGQDVVFITVYMNRPFVGMMNGRYRAFKTAPGRFVSETHGSHGEGDVLYWTNMRPIKD